MTSASIKRCAVIGQPIAHSKSPSLHKAFAAQFDLPLDYQKQALSADEFALWLRSFFAQGGTGVNVTLPYKAAALQFADNASERAKLAGAANTLGRDENGRIWADNTDGIGLVRDLQRLGVSLQQRPVLLLGAGGAARGVIPALLTARVASVQLLNRTRERALEIVEALADTRVQLASETWPGNVLLLSSVADGVADLLTAVPTDTVQIAYDLNYGARAESFVQAMRQRGVEQVFTGRGMLIEQAAESFRLWHGLMPDTAPLHQLEELP
ncbi:shikimate dehydrogenase [Permianibacter aggregans]|uniref:Shikimate dehydrogenase (NADP(+)) n=1 Tax=Permianibacter aggregans TaxID=1510150 RepID=A0A4V3D7U3_9GAMM|nr:shikimate dehydrogenase [Permianibacter aggregans]QGX40001.1 shikimate dehydrogenase [Permianibacter aggregans]TDQ49187.1 shikimate dehydrogenase [Permianibacter aggregans]